MAHSLEGLALILAALPFPPPFLRIYSPDEEIRFPSTGVPARSVLRCTGPDIKCQHVLCNI